MTQAVAPGKLIISGEHAVVHGRPALVMAVDRYVHATVDDAAEPGLSVSVKRSPGQVSSPPRTYTPEALRNLHRRATDAYAAFLADARPITDVLATKTDIIPFAVASVLTRLGVSAAERPLAVAVDIGLPPGCGMGASAAIAAAVAAAVAAHVGAASDRAQCFADVMRCEKLIHGRPSGVDPYIAVNGGGVRFQAGRPTPLGAGVAVLQAVHSGAPDCSTGECVEAVRARHVDAAAWDAFAAVTEDIEAALTTGDLAALIRGVRKNHRLLCGIGVVPQRVREFVAGIEDAGGAAKISGAGSVRGAGGGMVWVVGCADLAAMAASRGYPVMTLKEESDGVRLL